MQFFVKQLTLSAVLVFLGTLGNAQTTASQAANPAIHDTNQSFSLDDPQLYYLPSSGQYNPAQKPSTPQAGGIVSGTILDQTGAVSVGAQVRLTSEGKTIGQAISGENGQFSFSHVPAGHFQLTVTAAGFASQVFSGELTPGQSFLVPAIVLPIATAETKVQVGVPTVEVAEAQIKEQQKQRILAFIPNFLVTYEPDAVPLNAKQKFELSWKVAVDPVTLVGTAVYAGFEQAGDRYPEFGQGAEGYAKRYGTAYADALSGIFIGNAILPSLLKQDPRYFYKGTGSTKSRMLYALASSVICKGDNRRWQPNYSFILGSVAVGGISNLYVPASDRSSASLVFQNALIRIGQGSLGGLLQEFVFPRLTPRFRHHERKQQSTP